MFKFYKVVKVSENNERGVVVGVNLLGGLITIPLVTARRLIWAGGKDLVGYAKLLNCQVVKKDSKALVESALQKAEEVNKKKAVQAAYERVKEQEEVLRREVERDNLLRGSRERGLVNGVDMGEPAGDRLGVSALNAGDNSIIDYMLLDRSESISASGLHNRILNFTQEEMEAIRRELSEEVEREAHPMAIPTRESIAERERIQAREDVAVEQAINVLNSIPQTLLSRSRIEATPAEQRMAIERDVASQRAWSEAARRVRMAERERLL